MRLLLALVLALLPAAPALADPQIFTLAGNGAHDTAQDGEPATAAGVGSYAPLAVLAGGGFVVGGGADGVWRVDAQGTIHLVPGTRELHVSGLGALPGGGFLMTDALHGLVRLAGADGSIATVASGLNAPLPVAATPGGGFVVGVENGVRRVDPDGRIHTIAGPTSPRMDPEGLAVTTDGSVLVADPAAARLDRVAPGGTFSVEPLPHVTPRGVAALPDGGYLVSDGPREDTGGRVLRVAPDGAITVLAGSRRPTLTAPGGLAQELTGESALQAELRFAGPIAALPDGGALLSDDSGAGGLIRYVTPAAPGLLGAAVLRDRDRVFAPGHGGFASVALTRPASVTLTVAGHTVTAALPAGVSRLARPALARRRPVTVTVLASGADGQRATDRARIYSPGWLPEETAELVARSTGAVETRRCARHGAARVDCRVVVDPPHCRVTSVALAGGRLRWSRHPCGARPRLRPLRRADWHCDALLDAHCPPRLFGRVREAALIPSD